MFCAILQRTNTENSIGSTRKITELTKTDFIGALGLWVWILYTLIDLGVQPQQDLLFILPEWVQHILVFKKSRMEGQAFVVERCDFFSPCKPQKWRNLDGKDQFLPLFCLFTHCPIGQAGLQDSLYFKAYTQRLSAKDAVQPVISVFIFYCSSFRVQP